MDWFRKCAEQPFRSSRISRKDLEDSIRRQLELNKEQMVRMDMENQLIDQLLKKSELSIPESAVNKQLEHLWQDTQRRLMMEGMKKEDVESKAEEFKQELKKMAERDIRVFFIFDKIAQQESIKPEKQDTMFKKVMEFLMKEAVWSNEDETYGAK